MGIDGQRVDYYLLSFWLPYSYVIKLTRWIGVARRLLTSILILWACM
jgi:hypothetical protein